MLIERAPRRQILDLTLETAATLDPEAQLAERARLGEEGRVLGIDAGADCVASGTILGRAPTSPSTVGMEPSHRPLLTLL